MGIPIIGDIIEGVTGIIEKVVPDADKKNEIKLEIQKLEDAANARYHEELMGQVDTNKVEAAHPSVFVAGWRPFIGWGCGCAFVYSAILAPLFQLQPADIAFVQTVLMGMLGIAGMRSYEKAKGVETEGIKLPSIFGKKVADNKSNTNKDEAEKTKEKHKETPAKKPPRRRWNKI